MPLKIFFNGQYDAPKCFCDHCDEEITDATDGNYQWCYEDGQRTAWTTATIYQNMAEDHTFKGVGECHPYREFEGMQPSR
jgi:hypothetical protein